MNIDEMNLQQVDERIAQLDEEVRGAENVEAVESRADEKKQLLERRKELEDLEKRKQEAIKLNKAVEPVKTIEVRKEEKKMDYSNMNLDERRALPEYRTAWLMKLQGRELSTEQRALMDAGAAIPTETWAQIVEKAEYISPLLSKITISNIPANLSIPVESAAADASWLPMGTASTDSADALTSVELAAHKLIKTVEIGADVSVMAIPDFERYLVAQLARKVARAVENAVINGTGANQPTGLLNAGVITNVGTFTAGGMTYNDILAIIADLPDHGYRQNASFVMPSALFYSDVLPALTDKGSGLDVQAVEKERVLSYPIILCDRVPADTVIFGDLSYFHFNWAKAPEVQADNSVGFRTGSTVYRAMALADGKVTQADAFTKYTRGA